MTLGEWLPNAVLCALALLFAAHAPVRDRKVAVLAAGLVVADWALFVLSWTPYSLHLGLLAMGVDIKSWELWPLIDSVVGAIIIVRGWDKAFAWALWFLLFSQVAAMIYAPVPALFDWLDWLFWGQVAVFLFIGFGGVRQRVVFCWHSLARGIGLHRRRAVSPLGRS